MGETPDLHLVSNARSYDCSVSNIRILNQRKFLLGSLIEAEMRLEVDYMICTPEYVKSYPAPRAMSEPTRFFLRSDSVLAVLAWWTCCVVDVSFLPGVFNIAQPKNRRSLHILILRRNTRLESTLSAGCDLATTAVRGTPEYFCTRMILYLRFSHGRFW